MTNFEQKNKIIINIDDKIQTEAFWMDYVLIIKYKDLQLQSGFKKIKNGFFLYLTKKVN